MRRTSIPAGLALCLLVLPTVTHAEPALLGGTGFTLYEVSERVHMDPSTGEPVRVSPLLGFAELGTPICPSAVWVTVPKIESCTVIATGTNVVSLATATSHVFGSFDVVLKLPSDSSVHIPNAPVLSGTFVGTIDLTQAVTSSSGVPLLLFIRGSFRIEWSSVALPACSALPCTLPFSGTFRVPFAIDDLAHPVEADRGHAAFYLADDRHRRIPVRPTERAAGFPTVRLEVSFGP